MKRKVTTCADNDTGSFEFCTTVTNGVKEPSNNPTDDLDDSTVVDASRSDDDEPMQLSSPEDSHHSQVLRMNPTLSGSSLSDDEEESSFASPPPTVRKITRTTAHPARPPRAMWNDESPVLDRSPFILHHKKSLSRKSSNPFSSTMETFGTHNMDSKEHRLGAIDPAASYDSFDTSSSHSTIAECIMGGTSEGNKPEEMGSDSTSSDFLHRGGSCRSIATFTGSPIAEESSFELATKSSSSSSPDDMSSPDRISPKDVTTFPFDFDGANRGTPERSPARPPTTPFKSRPRAAAGATDLSPDRSHISRRRHNHKPADQPLPSTLSRFASDFQVLGQVGNGAFGTVYKCLSKLDGCTYAIKAFKRPARSVADQNRMLKEVYALAALSDLAETAAFHIVRYHQAWMDDDRRLYIQTEFCTSTLHQEMATGMLGERRKYKLLREISLALELIHRNDMVHLDIKPENIFVKNEQFKLGDFGLVSRIGTHDDVEEGDSRFMSKDLLSGDHNDLKKCDIFSLGATMYEVCLGRPLPANGEEWHDIRNGKLSPLPNTRFEMKSIIAEMMNPDPSIRPEAKELLQRRLLMSDEQQELIIERNKIAVANLALKSEEKRLKLLRSVKPDRKLMRRTTWDVDMMKSKLG